MTQRKPLPLNTDLPEAPARDAATVVLMRDASAGLEVFLLRRHGLSDVLGGAYVFPGGKLDASDVQLDPACLDQTPAQLHAALGEPALAPDVASGLFVAALREAFEESQVLITESGYQASAAERALPFNALLASRGLRLHTRGVLPWSRWITPRMPSVGSKRFDTRFFVAAAPSGQTAVHDDHETTASVWLAPRTALEQYWSGSIELVPPQIMSLAQLSRHATVASVLAEARQSVPPLVFPESYDEGGERFLCYPGDPRHSVATRAMPGPTRVVYRNHRFEPLEGFEGLFA